MIRNCISWIGTRLREAAKLPGFVLVVLVVGSYAIGENYPFSTFPMYSNPSGSTMYLYLRDGENEPVPVKTYTGMSSSNLSKTYGKYLDRIGDQKGIQPYKLPLEDQAAAGIETLIFLREKARARGEKGEGLPKTLKLIRVQLTFVSSGEGPDSNERIIVEQTVEE